MVTVTKYVWDPVFDCVTHELDENNNVKAEYHNEPQQYGGVLSQRRGTTTHYHHHDALGSTRFLTDSSGNVTDTYLHDAWGNLVASIGTTINPFKWVGKYGYYTDNSTAQVYVRARMYQPTIARWASIDPFQILDDLRRYLYSFNVPLSEVDPSGLWPLCHSETCNTGPRQKEGEGTYVLRVEVLGTRGDKCGSAGHEIRFHMRESHINPRTKECIGYADMEFGTLGDPRNFRFGDIVKRGCSAPQVSAFRTGPNKCWVADYQWTCPVTCENTKCGPSQSWLSVYWAPLLERPIGQPCDPRTDIFCHIMRANAEITFEHECCTLFGCSVNASIIWPLWAVQFTGDKNSIPASAVDVQWDPVASLWTYRVNVGSEPCKEDHSWIWRLS